MINKKKYINNRVSPLKLNFPMNDKIVNAAISPTLSQASFGECVFPGRIIIPSPRIESLQYKIRREGRIYKSEMRSCI